MMRRFCIWVNRNNGTVKFQGIIFDENWRYTHAINYNTPGAALGDFLRTIASNARWSGHMSQEFRRRHVVPSRGGILNIEVNTDSLEIISCLAAVGSVAS